MKCGWDTHITVNPLYLTNHKLLGENKHITSIKTFENGGYVTLKL
jgi:hypothetical protein